MKKAVIVSVLLAVVAGYCHSQEFGTGGNICLQIDEHMFYLRYSHGRDIVAAFGEPARTEFHKNMRDGFHWNNYTYYACEGGLFNFTSSEEGNVIRIAVNSNFRKNILIFNVPMKELNYPAVVQLMRQHNLRSVLETGKSIYAATEDYSVSIDFHFNDELKLEWFDMYYENPW